MSRVLIGLVVFLVGACHPARPAPPVVPDVVQIDAELVAHRVARDAWVVTSEPFFASNILVVRMPDDTVVICSSPFDTEATRALVRWVRTALRPRRIVAIATHFHPDGSGGNSAYAELGVETYASELTQQLIAARGTEFRDATAAGLDDAARAARVRHTAMVPARHTFAAADGLALRFGGEAIEVFYPGAAHSPDNVVVSFPARRLLFGGCMIKTGDSIGFTGDADLGHWEAAVHALERFDAAVVVPGHGAIGGPEALAHTIELVRAKDPGEGGREGGAE